MNSRITTTIKYFVIMLMTIAFCLGLRLPAYARQTSQSNDGLDCSKCHTCPTPTADNPCLHVCPTISRVHTSSEHKLSEAPDTIILGSIAEQYRPVHFDHKIHANMAQMNLKCATCHHYSPKGRIPACEECHKREKSESNLRQPTLKGAYHRQCLSCHREWSHDTKCVLCHVSQGKDISQTDSTDIIGISHPVITVPDKKVYNTPFETGPIVTFYHKEHIELYGLKCANCHKKENCGYCHDLNIGTELQALTHKEKTMEEIHAICNDCHKSDKCTKCHSNKEKPPFSHERATGWTLNHFHKKLDCRACHPTGKPIAKLNRSCSACHSGWNQDNFKHEITGLRLNETHLEADCEDCHTDGTYEHPDCSGCHDEDISLKNALPGTRIN